MHHPADLKAVDRDKLHQWISNLPTWAVPPPAALEAVIRSVMGVDDLEWDPMANGTITLKFNTEQVWMAHQNIKIYIAYRLSTPTPTSTCIFTNSTCGVSGSALGHLVHAGGYHGLPHCHPPPTPKVPKELSGTHQLQHRQ